MAIEKETHKRAEMTINPSDKDRLIHALPKEAENITLPEKFTFPFNYQPHALCVLAAEELQAYLAQKEEWQEELSLEGDNERVGKMFGVMIVRDSHGQLGYLAAFSGAIAGKNQWPGFVPTLYDRWDPNSFFKIGEQELNAINEEVVKRENAPDYLAALQDMEECRRIGTAQIEAFRKEVKDRKAERRAKRAEAESTLSEEAYSKLLHKASLESQADRKWLKGAIKQEQKRMKIAEEKVEAMRAPILALKEARREKSNAIQQQIFDQYTFLNTRGEKKGVREIFGEELPPAGAGDCAGPRLLQYAFAQNLSPIAMAEFWYGPSPKTIIRKHLNYYPACKGKCGPIMGHMLQGLEMEEDPLPARIIVPDHIEVLYEDEVLAVVNKPSGFLSVPGKSHTDSILERIKQQMPDAEGPIIVHRLDMDTSGLMVVTKNEEVYKNLQEQFTKRTVKKRYTALLEGYVKKSDGYIDLPLRVDLDDRPRQMVCYQHGKAARTKFEVKERKNGRTLIHFYPITGRTHQLRMHAAHPDGLNCPITGDDLYGKVDERLHLHAAYLEFEHPVKRERMSFVLEADF
ncbi:pseudouridine synthase [Persicobacter diffluens]|uniref:pseudouridine synthase n=1 Tax=Persicobacter diffluens TaxID=981 RepID=UPI0030C77380